MVAGVFATLRIGAVFMPVNPLTKQDKLAYLLKDSRASALLTHAALRGTWQGALGASPTVHTCVVARKATDAGALPERCLAWPATAERFDAAGRTAHHRPGPRQHHLHLGLHRRRPRA